MKTKKNPFESKCNKCGKYQIPDKNRGNDNFTVYPCNEKCECGGEYVMYINGTCLKPYVKD